MVDPPRAGSELVVEMGLSGVAVAGGEDSVGDRAGDERVVDALGAKPRDVAVRVERPPRPGQGEADDRVALERRGRGFRRDRGVRGDVPDDPGMRGGARVSARQAYVVA